jgi:hypothetical protein
MRIFRRRRSDRIVLLKRVVVRFETLQAKEVFFKAVQTMLKKAA